MSYEVRMKDHTYFVVNSLDGKVLDRFHKNSDDQNKKEAMAKAQELANKESLWLESVKRK